MGAYVTAAYILFLGITFFVEVPGFRRKVHVKIGRRTTGICFVVAALIMGTVPYVEQHNLLPDDAFIPTYVALFAVPIGIIIAIGMRNARARRRDGMEGRMDMMKRMAILLFAMLMATAAARAEPIRYVAQLANIAVDAEVYGAGHTQAHVLSARNFEFDPAVVADVLPGEARLDDWGLSLKTRTSTDIAELVNLSIEPYCRHMLTSFDMGFMTREDATRQAIELAGALGLDCLEEAIYSVTRTHYNERYDYWVEFNKGLGEGDLGPADLPDKVDWLYEDLCYVIFLRQQSDGIPLYNRSYRLDGEMRYACGPDAYMSIGPDGLLDLNITAPIMIGGPMGDSIDILPYQAAAERFDQSPFSTRVDNIAIQRMTLSYIPTERDEAFTLRPAWIIEAVTDGDSWGIDYFVVDAITGAVMLDG